MNNRNIKGRRKPATKGQKMMRAITEKKTAKKKKLRAVASAPAAGFNDVDKSLSSKIITGLFIVLLLHIFAVAAIFIHGKFNKENIHKVNAVQAQPLATEQRGSAEMMQDDVPKISQSENYTWVNAGDTYLSIAEAKGWDVEELRKLNKYKPLKAGRAIKTPPPAIEVKSPELEAIGTAPRAVVEEVEDDVHRIIMEQPDVAVTPVVTPATTDFRVHTFKAGETLWSLSRNYNTSLSSILKANPHLEPTSIKEGTSIKIPR